MTMNLTHPTSTTYWDWATPWHHRCVSSAAAAATSYQPSSNSLLSSVTPLLHTCHGLPGPSEVLLSELPLQLDALLHASNRKHLLDLIPSLPTEWLHRERALLRLCQLSAISTTNTANHNDTQLLTTIICFRPLQSTLITPHSRWKKYNVHQMLTKVYTVKNISNNKWSAYPDFHSYIQPSRVYRMAKNSSHTAAEPWHLWVSQPT